MDTFRQYCAMLNIQSKWVLTGNLSGNDLANLAWILSDVPKMILNLKIPKCKDLLYYMPVHWALQQCG